ncbi:MAG: hypothetical protein MRY83_20990 [Flavobacteriales bacterium]|nr:hypothetical protein [Flavobacteriales bacterium]
MKVNKLLYMPLVLGLMLFMACPPAEDPVDPEKPKKDSTIALFQVGNELFSIPSPIQSAALIKASGAAFNADLMNSPQNASSYATTLQKALNLGVYGADLAYVNYYEQTQEAIGYLNASKKLADELGMTSAFSPELIKKFESNLDKKDTLIQLVQNTYRDIDGFLKNDEETKYIGALVLAGGWLEALYFTTTVVSENADNKIIQRIGEQKHSLENLIKLLQRYSNNEEYSDLVESLVELYNLFDQVEVTYDFVAPEHKPDQKLTIVNGTTSVKMSKEQMNAIGEKAKDIRSQIIS